MNEIKAFVGHSFMDGDKVLVAEFLKIFDQIRGLVPHFSWEHAESAEPRELRDKVLSLIGGKNVFIGICTARESVIAHSLLHRVPLLRQALMGNADAFELKTSDWIIQEIGLAIGRGLDLILLVENGVRAPGGLQGNIEYIQFDRTRPEKAFGKIAEMIKALSPKPAVAVAGTSEGELPKFHDEFPPKSGDDKTDPKPDWSKENYKHAMVRMLLRDDPKGADRIGAAYLASLDYNDVENAAEWEASREYFNTVTHGNGDLGQLRKLAQEHPDNMEISAYLADALAYHNESDEAAQLYDALWKRAESADVVRRHLANAAREFAQSKRFDLARERIERLKGLTLPDIIAQKTLLDVIRSVAEDAGDTDVLLATMERMVELNPADNEIRFNLAYRHSQIDNDDLALFHYLRISPQDRDSITWNNLGVSFDRFQMPGKAVEAYRRSERGGQTLAMSNIAQKLIKGGFLPEARELLEKASAAEGRHVNIATDLAALAELPEAEESKQKEVLEKVRPKSEFFRQMGRAISAENVTALAAQWNGPQCPLDAAITAERFTASGTYESMPTALAAALLPGMRSEPVRYRIEFDGVVRGRMVEGTVRRIREGEKAQPTSLLGFDPHPQVVMILSEHGRAIEVCERPYSASPSYYSLNRLG